MSRHILPIVGDKARALVRQHLDSGALCAIVTATNSFVTAPMARESRHRASDRHHPGAGERPIHRKPRGTPSFREGKITRVEAWLEAMGLWWSSFERSWFYSDSQNDLPLLSRVSNPVAVDPDPTLRAHAESAGWPVVSLRADGSTDRSLMAKQYRLSCRAWSTTTQRTRIQR
jgi:phosphoserine phosphatase